MSRYVKNPSPNSNQVALFGFPRTGDTFFRKYFESITNTITCSNLPMFNCIVQSLQLIVFAGQGISNSKRSDIVWLQMCHFPMRLMNDPNQFCNRAVIHLRHPRDTIVSLLHFFITISSEKAVKLDIVYEKFFDVWKRFAKIAIQLYKEFHEQIIYLQKTAEVPFYVYKFEDIMKDSERILSEIFSFVLNLESIEGTVIQQRIKEAVKNHDESTKTYKKKPSQKEIIDKLFD